MTAVPFHLTMEQLSQLHVERGATLRQLDKLDAEESLEDFWRLAWPIVEPKHPYVSDWAMGAIAEHLEAVHRGQIKKLLGSRTSRREVIQAAEEDRVRRFERSAGGRLVGRTKDPVSPRRVIL